MSRKNAYQAIQFRKPSCSPWDCCTRLSARARHSTSTSLPSHSSFARDDADHLEDSDTDLDQRSASSATLLSRRVSSLSMIPFSDASDASSESPLPASGPSRFLYPLHEPGQRTAQRTQRLRARTAAVIMSIPATCEDVIDLDEDELSPVPPVAPALKLRRVPGIRDLRRAFRDADDAPTSTPSFETSKASYELGILVSPTSPISSLSPRSSLRTLVDGGNTLTHTLGNAKTPYDSTIRSISISSRLTTKLYSTFSPSRTPYTPVTDTSQSKKYPVHTLLISQTRRRASLQLDTRIPRSPGERVWSCAKISQSVAKRAARRGTPRRVFSHPAGDPSP